MAEGPKFNKSGRWPAIGLLLSLTLAAILVNFFYSNADFSNPGKLIRYGQRLEDPTLLAEAYRLKALQSPSIEHTAMWIRYHHGNPPAKQWLPGIYQPQTGQIQQYLDSLPAQKKALSSFGNAALASWQGNQAAAIFELGEIRPWQQKHVLLLLGRINEGVGKYEEAYNYYRMEHQANPSDGYAYRRCYQISLANEWQDTTTLLVESPPAIDYLPKKELRFHWLKKGHPLSYLWTLCLSLAFEIALVDLIAAMLVMFTWLFYLIRIDPFTRHSRIWLLTVCIMGIVFALLPHVVYDLLELKGIYLNGQPLNDMAFSIFGIGLVEELVKAIPYLIFLKAGKLKEPFDHLICICASALGFSFSENLLYYDLGHLYLIHARALTAVVAHMCFSTIVAYGISRTLKQGEITAGAVVKWLLIAAAVHGLYDFWVVSSWAVNLQAITVVIYVLATFCWVRMLNNTLNLSSRADTAIAYPVTRIQFYLVASLSLIFAFEYVVTGYHFGSKAANNSLWDALRFGGYLIIFLSTSLSNIKIKPGYREAVLPWFSSN